jgi:hypothetical protein
MVEELLFGPLGYSDAVMPADSIQDPANQINWHPKVG